MNLKYDDVNVCFIVYFDFHFFLDIKMITVMNNPKRIEKEYDENNEIKNKNVVIPINVLCVVRSVLVAEISG